MKKLNCIKHVNINGVQCRKGRTYYATPIMGNRYRLQYGKSRSTTITTFEPDKFHEFFQTV